MSRFLFLLTTLTAAQAVDVCYSAIARLAQYDKLLGEAPSNPQESRLRQKQTVAASATTMEDFETEMRQQYSAGTGYSCGYTASWVTEVFYGLPRQYTRYRLGDTGLEPTANVRAGYSSIAGQKVIDFFQGYASFDNRVVFHLAHSSPVDHGMVIEQLPSQGGYRIYQSYNSAHGLAAWLSAADADLETLFANGDIMVNPKISPLFDGAIKALFGPNFGIGNYMSLPDAASPLVPFLKAYLTYFLDSNTKQSVLANLQKAKALYGQGAIINKADFFGTYLPKLANLSASLQQAWGTATPTPQAVVDLWLELYGVPNLLFFPNLPLNTIPNLMQLSSPEYYLQGYAVVVPDSETIKCLLNRNALLVSLMGSEHGNRRVAAVSNTLDMHASAADSSDAWLYGTLVGVSALVLLISVLLFIQRRSAPPKALDCALAAPVQLCHDTETSPHISCVQKTVPMPMDV